MCSQRVVLATVWPFCMCYAATSASSGISNIRNHVYNTKWYEYLQNKQKYVILILIRTQKDVYFNGLKIIQCDLNSFTQVRGY